LEACGWSHAAHSAVNTQARVVSNGSRIALRRRCAPAAFVRDDVW